jgi:hypothetical protein
VLVRDIFIEANGLGTDEAGSGPAPFRGDGRWVALYKHPLVLAVIKWGSAKAYQQRDPGRGSRLAEMLEEQFNRLLRQELDDYWELGNYATESGDLTGLHSTASHALTLSLVIAATSADLYQLGPALVRSFIKHLIAIWTLGRIPSEEDYPVDCDRLDDLLLSHNWSVCFWAATMIEMRIAAATSTPPLLDPVADFPTVKAILPPLSSLLVPPPSQREVNGPVPPFILAIVARSPTAKQALGWLDPLSPKEPGWEKLCEALLENTSKDTSNLPLYLSLAVAYLGAKMSDFTAWLRDVAGMRLLDLLIGAELETISHSGLARRELAVSAGVQLAYFDRLVDNEHLPEAIRRRAFLRDCGTRLERTIPPAALESARSAHEISILVPIVVALRQLIMLFDAPEPFQDLRTDANDVEAGEGIDDEEPEPLLRAPCERFLFYLYREWHQDFLSPQGRYQAGARAPKLQVRCSKNLLMPCPPNDQSVTGRWP